MVVLITFVFNDFASDIALNADIHIVFGMRQRNTSRGGDPCGPAYIYISPHSVRCFPKYDFFYVKVRATHSY